MKILSSIVTKVLEKTFLGFGKRSERSMSRIRPQPDSSARDVPAIVTHGHVEEESTNPCLINVLDKLRILTGIPGVSGKT